jgi:hypothetical protein
MRYFKLRTVRWVGIVGMVVSFNFANICPKTHWLVARVVRGIRQLPKTPEELRQCLEKIEQRTKIRFSRDILNDEGLSILLERFNEIGRGLNIIDEFYSILLDIEKIAVGRLGEDIQFSNVLFFYETSEDNDGWNWEEVDFTKDELDDPDVLIREVYNIQEEDFRGKEVIHTVEVNLEGILWLWENKREIFRQQLEGVIAHELGHIPLYFLCQNYYQLMESFGAGIPNPYIANVKFHFKDYWRDLSVWNVFFLSELTADKVAQHIAPESHKQYVKESSQTVLNSEDTLAMTMVYYIILTEELGLEDISNRLIEEYSIRYTEEYQRILFERVLPDFREYYQNLVVRVRQGGTP